MRQATGKQETLWGQWGQAGKRAKWKRSRIYPSWNQMPTLLTPSVVVLSQDSDNLKKIALSKVTILLSWTA